MTDNDPTLPPPIPEAPGPRDRLEGAPRPIAHPFAFDPACRCGHSRSGHTHGTGDCPRGGCGCKRYRAQGGTR